MKTALIVTGILAALVVIFPGLVVIGMFLLVIPGLVLMAMPTVFLYLLATWLIRMVLPIESDLIGYPVAAGCAVTLASLAVWPLRISAEREFEAAIQREFVPDTPIAVSGHILFEQRSDNNFNMAPSCSPLCLALLDLDGVESVTMIRDEIPITFALEQVDPEDADLPESLEPYDPSQIIAMADQARDYTLEQQVKQALADSWAARLKGPQRLVVIDRPEAPPDWHLINYREGIARFQEIRDRRGEAVLRYQTVSRDLLALPPYIGFSAGSSGFGFSGRGFNVAASGLHKQTIAPTPHPEDNFARAIALKDYWDQFAADLDDQSE